MAERDECPCRAAGMGSRWLVLGAFLIAGLSARADVVTYDWPTGPGEGVLSDRYAVRITSGGKSAEVEVLMSTSWTEPGGGPDVFRDRTFSWASFSSDFEQPVVVEVEKLYGSGTRDVEVFPSGYNVTRFPSADGRKVTFVLRKSRYLSINFKTADNTHAADGLVRHMLMVFADPMEIDPPDREAPGTLVFDSETTQEAIAAATVVYFDPGFHPLRGQLENGILQLSPDKTIYLSGGAFVSGKIDSKTGADRCVIRGRGAISGRDYPWEDGQPISALVHASGESVVVEGILAFDNNMHGIVPGDSATLTNVKVWGWHYNSDGFRPWGGTVDHCFTRPTDDAFYVGGNDLRVTDTVIWQSFNGAVVTCGWGSPQKPYNTTGFWMEDCHILYPEWNGIGNNNGIIASQLPYAATSTNIRFNRIRVDGNICALTNLKRNEKQERVGAPGGISDITFRKFIVTGTQVTYNEDRTEAASSRSIIRGNGGFMIEDVVFDDVRIGGVTVTEANQDAFFTIDPSTTSGIAFEATEPVVAGVSPVVEVLIDTDGFGFAGFEGQWGVDYEAEFSEDLVTWQSLDQRFHGVDQSIVVTLRADAGGNPLFVRLKTTAE